MVTKGIIEDIIDKYSIKIRIPTLNGIGNTELTKAIVCSIPNTTINFKIGDVVVVGFEDNSFSSPIVIGFLYRDSDKQSLIDLRCGDIILFGDIFFDRENSSLIEELRIIKTELNNLTDEIKSIKESMKE